ncbi:DNA-directed RNA polymerase alpha subunit [Pedobacter sp. CG_S7]|uniref:hypothetical protein n=1 Tax=Pedobacter sp. CG_S7 TaxID=3143930 RepID=UPI0033917F73
MEIADADLTVRAMNSLKGAEIWTIEQIQERGRTNFLRSKLTYAVKLEVLNFLHKNHLYFSDDEPI